MKMKECTVGTAVTYWPIRWEDGTFDGVPFHSVIRHEGYMLYTKAVCHIEGKAGCVECNHLVKRETLADDALALCLAIEQLPASEQATALSVMASALLRRIESEAQ